MCPLRCARMTAYAARDAVDHAAQVHVDGLVPVPLVELLEQAADRDAGVVDHDIEASVRRRPRCRGPGRARPRRRRRRRRLPRPWPRARRRPPGPRPGRGRRCTTWLPRATSSAAMARPMPEARSGHDRDLGLETAACHGLRINWSVPLRRSMDGLRGWGRSGVRCGHGLEDTVVDPAGAPPVGRWSSRATARCCGRTGRGTSSGSPWPRPCVGCAGSISRGERRPAPPALVTRAPDRGPVEALQDVAGGELDHRARPSCGRARCWGRAGGRARGSPRR